MLAFGLLQGLLLAAIGSLVMLIARASRPTVVVSAQDPGGYYVNKARHPAATETPSVLVLRSAGAWVYFNANKSGASSRTSSRTPRRRSRRS